MERGSSAKSASETRGYVFEATTPGALAKEAQTLVGDVCVDSDMVVSEEKEEKDAIKKKAICRSEPSVLNNSTDICSFINDNDVDIQEDGWLRSAGDEAKCADLSPPGYSVHSFPRDRLRGPVRGGGIAIIVNNSLKHQVLSCSFSDLDHPSFEAAYIILNINRQRLNLFCVYRPPPSKLNKFTNKDFFQVQLLFCRSCSSGSWSRNHRIASFLAWKKVVCGFLRVMRRRCVLSAGLKRPFTNLSLRKSAVRDPASFMWRVLSRPLNT
ncbi:hypothetical protein ACOMHN_016974 [Nucella lapillus]